jgi:hypothetical protein
MKNKYILSVMTASLVLLLCFSQNAQAKCAIKIDSNIRSGWKKQASYTTYDNILTINGKNNATNDADSIYIGSIDNMQKDCNILKIAITDIIGSYPWGGKAFGIVLSAKRLENDVWGNITPFQEPKNHQIEDGFIKGELFKNDQLIYDLSSMEGRTIYIGAKVFIGAGNTIKLQFSME